MDNQILLQILQLDSIVHLLTWEERVKIHLYRNGRAKMMTTPRILNLHDWIVGMEWQPPEMRYGQDRLLYFLTPTISKGTEQEWRPIEELETLMKQFKF